MEVSSLVAKSVEDNSGVSNEGYEEQPVSKKHLVPVEKYKERSYVGSNRVNPLGEESIFSSHSNQHIKSSAVGFNCCKLSHRRRSDLTDQRLSPSTFHDASIYSSSKYGSAYHISGRVVDSIPDVISSHPPPASCNQLAVTPNTAVANSSVADEVRIIGLEHVRQRYSWDCGIACVMMVLSGKHRQYLAQHLDLISDQEGFQTSTWSIDLAYLLHRFSVPFRYYTVTLGVDPGLTQEKFYETVIYKDAMRVVDRFRYAESHGISVEKTSIPLAGMLSHLQSGLPIIVLTNAQLLHCYNCNNHPGSKLRNCFTGSCSTPYQGHFVVLLGCDPKRNLLYYANPSAADELCHCSYQQLQDARLSYGTDEDIIFIDSDHGCLRR